MSEELGSVIALMHNVLEFLEQSALEKGGKLAVTDESGRLTYQQLLLESQFAGVFLAREIGTTGRPVMVWAEKSCQMLGVLMGVLQAGCFYVPVDPNAPDARVASMYDTLGCPLVVVDATSAPRLKEALPQARYVLLGDLAAPADWSPSGQDLQQLAGIRQGVLDADPVYVLFTSGSTGTPKGVAVSHRAVIDFIGSFVRLFGFTGEDVFANQAPFDFDVSVKDIYSSLAVGATLAIVPRALFSQPAALLDYVNAQKATVMIWAVAALCLVSNLHGLDYAGLPTVGKVLFSGEVMPMKHLRTWMERLPEALFVNLYGPTEITCNCTYHVVDRQRAYPDGLPLGVAFPNRQVMLLADDNTVVAEPGQQGEICVRGASVALGYYANPDQTAKAFVQNPCQAAYPEIIYRTGDLGIYSNEGDLFFNGRKDNQIKHLGHRIELEEIDTAFEKQPGIDRCRSVFHAEKSRIYSFYEGEADEAAVLERAQEELPVFMIPNALVKVESMPLTKNGKVDRKALLAAYLERKERQKQERRAARRRAKEQMAGDDHE